MVYYYSIVIVLTYHFNNHLPRNSYHNRIVNNDLCRMTTNNQLLHWNQKQKRRLLLRKSKKLLSAVRPSTRVLASYLFWPNLLYYICFSQSLSSIFVADPFDPRTPAAAAVVGLFNTISLKSYPSNLIPQIAFSSLIT